MSGDRKEFLICVDSDGCAMDTMNSKHISYFGPLLVDCYGLRENRAEVLKRWNTINLYSMTRGINRFLALKLLLEELSAAGLYHADISRLTAWVETADSLSNAALKNACQADGGDGALQLALVWSEQVNQAIRDSGSGHQVFAGVEEALVRMGADADIVVVSSANQEALEAEWRDFADQGHIKRIMSQSDGSKAECIKILLAKGYRTDHVLMIGDAPGDQSAAAENGVYFYPILAGREEQSWAEFLTSAAIRFLAGEFTTAYQLELIDSFQQNLETGS